MGQGGLAAILSATLLCASSAADAAPKATIIRNVTVVSPERARPLRGADVLIRDGRIAAVGRRLSAPASAQAIDGAGRFLIPGLIDSHVHLGSPVGLTDAQIASRPELWASYKAQLPRAYLAFGFTTVVDVNIDAETREWFGKAPLRPRLYHCGQAISVAGGYGARKLPPEGKPKNVVYEPAHAKSWPAGLDPADHTPRRAVDRAAASGATCVKVFVEPGFGLFDWPTLQADTLAAIRRETRRRGLVMMVHATGTPAWRAASAADADVIVHGLLVWPGDRGNPVPTDEARAAVVAAAKAGLHVQPSLQVIRGEWAGLDRSILDDPRLAYALPAGVLESVRAQKVAPAGPRIATIYERIVARTHATFRLMREAGIPLILGSDTPAGEGIGNPPGLNGRLELQGWAQAGALPAEILRAATLENARVLGLGRELGSVEVGKRADLLLLRADPLAGVSAYDTLETVILDGEPIAREALRPRD